MAHDSSPMSSNITTRTTRRMSTRRSSLNMDIGEDTKNFDQTKGTSFTDAGDEKSEEKEEEGDEGDEVPQESKDNEECSHEDNEEMDLDGEHHGTRYPLRQRNKPAFDGYMAYDSSSDSAQIQRRSTGNFRRTRQRRKSRRSSNRRTSSRLDRVARKHQHERDEEDEEDEENDLPQSQPRYSFRDRSKTIPHRFTYAYGVDDDASSISRSENHQSLIEQEQCSRKMFRRTSRTSMRASYQEKEEGLDTPRTNDNDKSTNRSPERGRTERRYSLRNRDKAQSRELIHVFGETLRKPAEDPYIDYTRRKGRRTGRYGSTSAPSYDALAYHRKRLNTLKKRRHGRHSNGYDSGGSDSSERGMFALGSRYNDSDDEEGPKHFRRLEKRRHERELSAIMPINGPVPASGREIKDDKRADIVPLEIDASITWENVGGLKKHVSALKEMVMLPLLYPEFFKQYNVLPPCGVLFYGPPGTGKTLLARALANSCSGSGQHVTFFMRKGADCLSKWVGEAERQLRLLFEQAKKCQPSIIFFDEIDGLAPVRSTKQDQIHASIVSTLLALMDGLDARGQVVVIGATNRVDAIDPALRRPGRFDRELAFTLPSITDREEIIDIHTKAWTPPLKKEFKTFIAEKTVGYCGADIKALASEAALRALRRQYPQIYQSKDKLLIDVQKIRVLRTDFLKAMNSITPAAHRSALTHASPLPAHFVCLLKSSLDEIYQNVLRQFPQASASSELEDGEEVDEEEETLAVYGVQVSHTNTEDEGHQECDRAESPQDLPQRLNRKNTFSWPEHTHSSGTTLHSPRYLITGANSGMGQRYLAASLLHRLEHLTVFSLALSTILSDQNAATCEQAVIRCFMESRRHTPCIVYWPEIDVWWADATALMRRTVVSLIQDLPLDLPLFLLGTTAHSTVEDLPEVLQQTFFPSRSSESANFHARMPRAFEREEFFQDFFTALMTKPRKITTPMRSKYPELPLAPKPPKSKAETVKLTKETKERNAHYLRELRIFLDQVLLFCMTEKRYQVFCQPIDIVEVPDYYAIITEPMYLELMLEKLNDGKYLCLEDFLLDINLLVQNAQQYNPKNSSTRTIAHLAANMQDNILSYAHRFKKQQGYDLFAKCAKIADQMRSNSRSAIRAEARVVRGIAKAFAGVHSAIPESPQGLRSSARLRGVKAPDISLEMTTSKKDTSRNNSFEDVASSTPERSAEADANEEEEEKEEEDEVEVVKEFSVGDQVFVQSRTMPGMNKEGGAGFITSVNSEEKTYDVKYVLGGSEKDVPVAFISNLTESSVRNSFKVSGTTSRHSDDSEPEEKSLTQMMDEYLAEHIWPYLQEEGWTKAEDPRGYFPPGIDTSNGLANEDYFTNSTQVLEYVKSEPKWAAKCFGERFVHQQLDDLLEKAQVDTTENSLTAEPQEHDPLEEEQGEGEDGRKRALEGNESEEDAEVVVEEDEPDRKRQKVTGIETETMESEKDDEAPEEELELIIDTARCQHLLSKCINKTANWSITELHQFRIELFQLLSPYSRVYDRTELVEKLDNKLTELR